MRIPQTNKKAGWTLIELTVVVGILIIIVGVAIAALATSKSDSSQTGAEGSAKSVNQAISRAVLKGDTNPAIVGEAADDIEVATAYLQAQGYFR